MKDFIIKDNILTKYKGKETEIIVPDNIEIIAENAFWGCFYIKSITIPDSVKTIGEGAFYTCINLKYINLPESISHIDYETFAYCISLKNIRLPDSIISIDRKAFKDSRLTEIELKGLTISDPKGLVKKTDGCLKVSVIKKLESSGIKII